MENDEFEGILRVTQNDGGTLKITFSYTEKIVIRRPWWWFLHAKYNFNNDFKGKEKIHNSQLLFLWRAIIEGINEKYPTFVFCLELDKKWVLVVSNQKIGNEFRVSVFVIRDGQCK